MREFRLGGSLSLNFSLRRQSGIPVRRTGFPKADIDFHISALLETGLIAAFADTSDYPLLAIPGMAWCLIWPS